MTYHACAAHAAKAHLEPFAYDPGPLGPDEVDTVMRGQQGGFATHVRAANWRSVHPVPDAIASEHATPLTCAGTTVLVA